MFPDALLAVNIHAGPCPNRCRHCWNHGAPGKPLLAAADLRLILGELAAARPGFQRVAFFLLDEPTARADFLGAYEYAGSLGLLDEQSFVATNGAGWARADAEKWARLRRAGVAFLQLTFYGVGAAHDAFAGRRGAFDDVVMTARRASEFGFPWTGGVLLQPRDAGDVVGTLAFVKDLAPPLKTGWFVAARQGRGYHGDRPRAPDLAGKPALQRNKTFQPEYEHRARILAGSDLGARPFGDLGCGLLTLDVEPSLDVYLGGACDAGGLADALPSKRDLFRVGSLRAEKLEDILGRYYHSPLPVYESLAGETWGSLAAAFGSETNDELFEIRDLIGTWARAHLKRTYGLE